MAKKTSTHILGISAYYHDSAAAIVRDGEIIAAAQEERFTRKKHDPSFPTNAIAFCLKQAGVTINDVDHVAFYDKPFLKLERLLLTYLNYAPSGLLSYLTAMPVWIKEKIFLNDAICRQLSYDGEPLFLEHHESHAASAFFPSPFKEAAILTMDGVGNGPQLVSVSVKTMRSAWRARYVFLIRWGFCIRHSRFIAGLGLILANIN